VTHVEVQRGLLDAADPSVSLCVIRRFTETPTGPGAGAYIEHDPSSQARVAALRSAVENRLDTYQNRQVDGTAADLMVRYAAHWGMRGPLLDEDVFTNQLRSVLERRVRAVIARRRARARRGRSAMAVNARFAAERLGDFVGREEPLAAIAAYLKAPAEVPLLVAGPGGAGKSTLLAKTVEQAAHDHPAARVLVRYIGVTPGAASRSALLDGLRAELAATYHQRIKPVREEVERAQAFRDALDWATSEQPLILILDALDQLGRSPVALDWLPDTLPPHVHLIVSLLDEADRPELAALLSRQPAPHLVPLGKLAGAEGDTLLRRWLVEAGRTLRPAQRSAVLTAFAREGRPLFLKLAFEEARRWRSWRRCPARSSRSTRARATRLRNGRHWPCWGQ
jgi:hypothetical protein